MQTDYVKEQLAILVDKFETKHPELAQGKIFTQLSPLVSTDLLTELCGHMFPIHYHGFNPEIQPEKPVVVNNPDGTDLVFLNHNGEGAIFLATPAEQEHRDPADREQWFCDYGPAVLTALNELTFETTKMFHDVLDNPSHVVTGAKPTLEF